VLVALADTGTATGAVCLAVGQAPPPLPQAPPEMAEAYSGDGDCERMFAGCLSQSDILAMWRAHSAAQAPPELASGSEDDWERMFAGIFSRSDIAAMRRDCSASLPPSPPATPAPLPFAQRSWQLPLRVGLLAPIQVSLALVVVCAAFAAELYTDPAFVFAAAGFAAIAAANLAQASPRIVARALTMMFVGVPTLRLIHVLVSSPAELTRDLDKLIEGRLGLLSLCAGVGASYGALPPAALPSSRKLPAAAYFACGPALTCVALVLCARTGDERMLSFEMLYGGLPFAASFLAAQAVSYSSLRQDAPPSATR